MYCIINLTENIKKNTKHENEKKKKKTTNTHSWQASEENDKHTSPFHSMALPSWYGMEDVWIWKFVYSYVCIFVCVHLIYMFVMFVRLSSWSTRTWSRMVTLCAGSSFPNKTGISTSPRNFGLQNIFLFFDGNIIIFLLWNLDQTLRQIQSASTLFSCCSQRHNLLISPKRPSYLFSADAIYGMED